ncbi:unnamed protein product [Rotaria sordida]|uniref:Uncharacterized protein n=1 Tax=Rotaria sordida TaxID=392033 RepID=A0A814RC77_9BILA|nr:unnamed protein product [Rotaria sordida]CAF3816804.1 unnamed protein product [Rotaria sordida]
MCPITLVDSNCKDKINTNEILRKESRFVNSVFNGKHFVVGQDYAKINIVHVYGELQAFAIGSDILYEDIHRLNLFPELIKAACSVLEAWGESTLSATLLHLRSLD